LLRRRESEPSAQAGRCAENRKTNNINNDDDDDYDYDNEASSSRDDTEAQLGDSCTSSWEALAPQSVHHQL